MAISVKTIERLSKYRSVLQKYKDLKAYYIFSHDLASMLRINPVHVRRDLMLIGFAGNYRNGYQVADLLESIDKILPRPKSQQATIIGMGEQGVALLNLILYNPNCPLQIPVTFDIELKNTVDSFSGIPCYNLSKAPTIIQSHKIRIAILTIHDFDVQEIVDSLLPMGIKGFLNLSSGFVKVPKNIYLREFNLHTLLDEMAYFVNADAVS